MSRAPCGLGRDRGRTDDVDHRHVLGVTARDRIDRAELADPERRAQHADASHPGIPIGGIARAELVRTSHPVDRRMVFNVVEHGESEITGNAEHAVDAGFGQSVEKVVGNRVGGHAISQSLNHCMNKGAKRMDPAAAKRWRSSTREQRATRFQPSSCPQSPAAACSRKDHRRLRTLRA